MKNRGNKDENDTIVEQFKQLIFDKSFEEKQMAIDVLKVIFNHLDTK